MKRIPDELAAKLDPVADDFLAGGTVGRMDAVAREIGVPRATLYYHFSGKDDLVAYFMRDKMGRVTQVNHAHGLIENFAYDGLGQQIKKWNNLLVVGAYYDPYTGVSSPGTPEIATTDYDTQGRIIHQKDFGGDVTTHTFTWDANLATGGVEGQPRDAEIVGIRTGLGRSAERNHRRYLL